MTKTTLDARVAAALAANGSADLDQLVSLRQEALDAIAAAKLTLATETARALDLSNTDPDAADNAARKAELTVARLTQAVPRLKTMIDAISARDYSAEWHVEVDRVKTTRDLLANELESLYPQIIDRLSDLFGRIDENTKAIDALHLRAPSGEPRRLSDAEQAARGIDRYTASQPRLRDRLQLPDPDRPSELAFPPQIDFNAMAAAAMRQSQLALAQKFALSHSADWAAARELEDAQKKSDMDEREAALAAEATEQKRAYEQHLQQLDRRRRGLES